MVPFWHVWQFELRTKYATFETQIHNYFFLKETVRPYHVKNT